MVERRPPLTLNSPWKSYPDTVESNSRPEERVELVVRVAWTGPFWFDPRPTTGEWGLLERREWGRKSRKGGPSFSRPEKSKVARV